MTIATIIIQVYYSYENMILQINWWMKILVKTLSWGCYVSSSSIIRVKSYEKYQNNNKKTSTNSLQPSTLNPKPSFTAYHTSRHIIAWIRYHLIGIWYHNVISYILYGPIILSYNIWSIWSFIHSFIHSISISPNKRKHHTNQEKKRKLILVFLLRKSLRLSSSYSKS